MNNKKPITEIEMLSSYISIRRKESNRRGGDLKLFIFQFWNRNADTIVDDEKYIGRGCCIRCIEIKISL